MDYEVTKHGTYEFWLNDRLEKIREVNEKYDLENNAIICFSGGIDSVVMHHLIDMALPNNKIPRVYSNTAIEYKLMVKFVEKLAKEDDRIKIVMPKTNIKELLETHGYPFKSKEHSLYLSVYQRSGWTKTVDHYLNRPEKKYACPDNLRYQFTKDFNIKISKKCCHFLKKVPFKNFMKENKKTIAIVGLRQEEKGARALLKTCTIFNKYKKYKLESFYPLRIITSDFEKWFIKKYNIEICELYKPPYNFKRTSCKGCPYNLYLEKNLEVLQQFFPAERKQCEIIWKPIYDEYRRIGYRLKN